jgi:hypothetical protein
LLKFARKKRGAECHLLEFAKPPILALCEVVAPGGRMPESEDVVATAAE